MKKIFLFISLAFVACSQEKKSEEVLQTDSIVSTDTVTSAMNAVQEEATFDTSGIKMNSAPQMTNPGTNATASVFKNEDGSYGYDILVDGKKFIHQPLIPSVPGNNGFKSEKNAQLAAELVIYKVKNNIIPPAVTKKELDSLGVLN